MIPGRIAVRPGVEIVASELQWRFSHASGPGGQGVNTADTRVELSLDLASASGIEARQRARALERLAGRLTGTVVTVVASEHRSQLRNREAAIDRLVALLRTATAPPAKPRRATKPSRGAVERRLAGKRRQAERKRLRRGDPGPAD